MMAPGHGKPQETQSNVEEQVHMRNQQLFSYCVAVTELVQCWSDSIITSSSTYKARQNPDRSHRAQKSKPSVGKVLDWHRNLMVVLTKTVRPGVIPQASSVNKDIDKCFIVASHSRYNSCVGCSGIVEHGWRLGCAFV